MVSRSYIDAFIPEGKEAKQCINCGICLQKCPVMKMGKEESRAEIQRLINGEEPQRVLNECTFCFTCNHYCPEGLNPYSLIMERMVAKNRKSGNGLPKSSEYMMTGKGETNYFLDMYNAGSAEDKAILDKWEQVPEKSQDTLFIGCYGRTVPQPLENSKALARLPKFGPRDACCGEIPHRFGDYAFFSERVERTKKMLEVLNTDRLVCYCGSCSNYFGNIWPNYHGVKLPFEVISLYEWLWEKYNSGELNVQRTVSKDMAISDSCYTSELGNNYFEAIRGLHKAAGMNVIELENNRYDSLCCGFASGLRNNYDNTQVAIEAKKKVDQVLATGAKNVSCNCPGCYAGIVRSSKTNDAHLRVHFAINEILYAFGDDI
ncbi:MAG: (Fe-S)-binding protein [Deltaproteobacteria bacterium]|nr:(Fe-S)-binding protein [Deltaproteobacteria bacterium]